MLDISKRIADGNLFKKRIGRDKTVKMFWSYVRNLACLAVSSVIFALALPAPQAFIFCLALLFVTGIFGIYSILSMRLRMIEERIEANRVV